MNYQVDWLSGAEDKLVKIWLAARDRQFLREAIDGFEQQCAIKSAESWRVKA